MKIFKQNKYSLIGLTICGIIAYNLPNNLAIWKAILIGGSLGLIGAILDKVTNE